MSTKKSRTITSRYVGASLGSLPFVPSIVQELGESVARVVLEEQARRQSTALKAAERSSGMTREEIGDALVATPHLVDPVTRVLYAAGMNGDDEILEVLGGILGHILITPDDTEEAELILAGIAELKRIHLQVLSGLSDPPKMLVQVDRSYSPVETFEAALTSDGKRPPRAPDSDGNVLQSTDAWNAEALAVSTALSLTRTQMALAGLTRAGFALSPPELNGPAYIVSPAGTVVLTAIKRWKQSV